MQVVVTTWASRSNHQGSRGTNLSVCVSRTAEFLINLLIELEMCTHKAVGSFPGRKRINTNKLK